MLTNSFLYHSIIYSHTLLALSVAVASNLYFTVNPPSMTQVEEGMEVKLPCDVSDRSNMIFSWSMDDKSIKNTTRRYQVGRNLIISSVDRELDKGWFHCTALNTVTMIGIQSTSAILNVTWIADQADVSLRRPRGNITEGVEVTLKCDAKGSPTPRMKWYKNKIRIFEQADSGYKLLEARLRIQSVSTRHNGVYSCQAENEADVAASGESFLLNVKGPNSAFLKDDLYSKTTVTVRGRDVWMHCVFVNANSIKWYRGRQSGGLQSGALISNNTRFRTTVYNNGTLKISAVTRSDEGTFYCQGLGPDGVAQTFTAELKIAKLGRLTEENLKPNIDVDVPQILSIGDNFEVDCRKPSGQPSPTIRWLNSLGKVILNNPKVSVAGTKLVLVDVDRSHTSNYTCVAENMAGIREITVRLVVTVPPVLKGPPANTEVREGQLTQLTCDYAGTKPPWTQVSWLKDSQPLSGKKYESQAIAVDHVTGTLTIDKAEMSQEGQYSCVINTQKQTPVRSQAATLNVIRKLKFRPVPRSMTFEIGSSESVACHAEAEAPPTINWLRSPNTMNLPAGVTNNGGELTFSSIQKKSAGEYTCVATTTDPISRTPVMINATISIVVGRTPTITLRPSNETVKAGEGVMLHCEATGDPQPTVRWDKDGTIMAKNMSGHFKQLSNNSLFIESAELTDEATYGCIVGNIRGFKRSEMHLIVTSNITESPLVQDSVSRDFDTEAEKIGIGITKTIVIAVCSSVAYLALVIGLIVYCSIRMMKKKQRLKLTKKTDLQLQPVDSNHEQALETDGLMTAIPMESVLSNGNGYRVHERYPNGSTVIHEEGARSTHSQRSYRSNASSQSTKSNAEIVKYDRSKLHNIGVLGNGMYGDVFLAKAPGLSPRADNNQLVCVKRLVSREENIQLEFRQEVEMFHKLNHNRICRLLAICREAEPIYMVMEYCEWGDLKQFLIATSRTDSQELTIEPPSTAQKLSMCHQIATAMNYLADCRFVHKDLASRNVLLEPNLNVKIASLGLSKDIYASEYVQAKTGLLIPLRWTAPEAWLEDEYSTKSDIWSFACFLYEVFSGAEIPYPDKTNEQVIAGFESDQIQPEAGNNMPPSLQTIAYQCWTTSPKDRPDFSQIVTMFSGIRIDSCG